MQSGETFVHFDFAPAFIGDLRDIQFCSRFADYHIDEVLRDAEDVETKNVDRSLIQQVPEGAYRFWFFRRNVVNRAKISPYYYLGGPWGRLTPARTLLETKGMEWERDEVHALATATDVYAFTCPLYAWAYYHHGLPFVPLKIGDVFILKRVVKKYQLELPYEELADGKRITYTEYRLR